MPGTVLITGANGSLAQAFIAHLLATEKDLTLIGTVRNTSPSDANTASLRTILSKHPHHNISLEPLDLTSLSSVRRFTHTLSTQIKNGSIPPLSAIICNAFTWSLSGTTKYSPDGFETSFQVTYLSHFLLLMTLLPSMDKTKGRIVLLGSVAHYPERPNPLSRHLSYFPDDLDELVHPPVYPEEEAHDRGWQRYGTAKLMTVVLMNCLNRRLEKEPGLNVHVLTMDPGGLTDSRAHREQRLLVRGMFSVLHLLTPVLKYVTGDVRSTGQSGKDLVEVAVGAEFADARGYFQGLRKTAPAGVSEDVEKQEALWRASWGWTGLEAGETCLSVI